MFEPMEWNIMVLIFTKQAENTKISRDTIIQQIASQSNCVTKESKDEASKDEVYESKTDESKADKSKSDEAEVYVDEAAES